MVEEYLRSWRREKYDEKCRVLTRELRARSTVSKSKGMGAGCQSVIEWTTDCAKVVIWADKG